MQYKINQNTGFSMRLLIFTNNGYRFIQRGGCLKLIFLPHNGPPPHLDESLYTLLPPSFKT